MEAPFGDDVPEEFRNSALEYELRMYNGETARAVVYLVYAEPTRGTSEARGAGARDGKTKGVSDGRGFSWLPVMREKCVKGCDGPILSAIQRFGKQGRTQKSAASQKDAKPDAKPTAENEWKDSRNLFISIDEASNHVCAYGPNQCKAFRLLFGLYAKETNEFVGSGVSGPIRVLANNDVPKGAAAMRVKCGLSDSWNGWKETAEKSEDDLREIFRAANCPQPAGKANQNRRLDDATQQNARKPLQTQTNNGDKVGGKRAAAKGGVAPAPSKRPKQTVSQKAQLARESKSVKRTKSARSGGYFDFDTTVNTALQDLALGMPVLGVSAQDSQDLQFQLNAIMPSPLGTPPDEKAAGAGANPFAGMFGTPEYLAAQEILGDALNTADLPSLCTPGDKKAETNLYDGMPPPTTGMGTFKFTPGAFPNIASTGSMMSLSGLDSLGGLIGSAFGKTPAEFKTNKTESKIFTRSAKKVAATGEPTPVTQFVNSLLMSRQKASAERTASMPRTSRRSTRAALKEVAPSDAAPSTTAASKLITAPKSATGQAETGIATGVASAPGVEAAGAAFDVAPIRGARSRHASPTGVAPVRLFFASPSGRGGETLDGSDDEDDALGFASPNLRKDVAGANGQLFSARGRRTRNAPQIRLPRMASVPEIANEMTAGEKASDRAATKAARLSGHFRPVKMPPPPKHVAAGPDSIKRKTRHSTVHFRNDVNFENEAPSTSKRNASGEENEAPSPTDVAAALLSPGWPSTKRRKALNKHADASGEIKGNSPGFIATIKERVTNAVGWA